jgi:hypothetical protein
VKAWVHGSTFGSDPGPMGVGIVFEDGRDWCVALSGWGTTADATWNALTLCVEYFATEYEGAKRLTIISNDQEIVRQASKRLGVKRAQLEKMAIDFWYLRRIVRKLRLHVHIRYGEVLHATEISNAAAQIAADTVGVGPEEAERAEAEDPD